MQHACGDRKPNATCWAVTLCAALAIGLSACGGGGTSTPAKVAHVFVQITDPQLGMDTQYDKNPKEWIRERDMLARLMSATVQLEPKPSFIFVGGDMQNFWPNEIGDGRNANANVPNLTIDGKDLGFHQRADVKRELAAAESHGIPVYFTAGNHDVGDMPNTNNVDTMSGYLENWGPLHEVVLNESGVMYLQFNSQLYWFSDDASSVHKQEQAAWLDRVLERLTADIKLLVLLTHIPPFMDDVSEEEGWANWKKSDRTEVLGKMARRLGSTVPMLWVCGHFHGLVANMGSYDGVPMHIRVGSAAGTPMQWDGQASFTPEEASAIAIKAVGAAFDEDITDGDYANIGKRLQAVETRSGMRIFRTYDDGSFQEKWFTVKDLEDSETFTVDDLLSEVETQ